MCSSHNVAALEHIPWPPILLRLTPSPSYVRAQNQKLSFFFLCIHMALCLLCFCLSSFSCLKCSSICGRQNYHPRRWGQNQWICSPMWQKGLCRCDYRKDLEKGRLSWILWVGPMWLQVPYKREAGESETEKEMEWQKQKSERFENAMLLVLKMKEEAISQGMQVVSRNWKRK